MLYWFPTASLTNYYKHDGLKTTDIYSLTLLEGPEPSEDPNPGVGKVCLFWGF